MYFIWIQWHGKHRSERHVIASVTFLAKNIILILDTLSLMLVTDVISHVQLKETHNNKTKKNLYKTVWVAKNYMHEDFDKGKDPR